jgi:hypothetical protein
MMKTIIEWLFVSLFLFSAGYCLVVMALGGEFL